MTPHCAAGNGKERFDSSHPVLDGPSVRSERVIAYLDGFNLYHGLMDAKMGSSRWLDLVAMSQSLLGPNQQLVLLRYFTTRIRNRPDKAELRSGSVGCGAPPSAARRTCRRAPGCQPQPRRAFDSETPVHRA